MPAIDQAGVRIRRRRQRNAYDRLKLSELPESPAKRGRWLEDWLLTGYVVCLPVQFRTESYWRFAPSDMFLALLLLRHLLVGRGLRLPRSAWSGWHTGLIACFFMAGLVATIRSGYVTQPVLTQKIIGLLSLFGGYALLAAAADSWRRIEWLLRIFVISVGLQNLAAIAATVATRTYGVSLPWINYGESRLAGFLVDPNAYGGLLVLALVLHLTTHTKRPLVPGTAGVLLTATMAMGVLLTYSRSAWMGLAAALVVITLLRPSAALRLTLLAMLAIAVVLWLFGSEYMDVMHDMAFREAQVQSRVTSIQDALAMLSESPAVGIGLGVYGERQGMIIHNTPVWILTECGILGFVVFSGFACWFIQRGRTAYRFSRADNKAIVLALVLGHVAMLGLSLGIEALYQRHWWMVMALIASSYVVARREKALRGGI